MYAYLINYYVDDFIIRTEKTLVSVPILHFAAERSRKFLTGRRIKCVYVIYHPNYVETIYQYNIINNIN